MQVSIENRYNSTLNEQTLCKGKTCYFFKMRQTRSQLTPESRSRRLKEL